MTAWTLTPVRRGSGKRADYYELESDAHGGPVFFADTILDIVSDFCQSK